MLKRGVLVGKGIDLVEDETGDIGRDVFEKAVGKLDELAELFFSRDFFDEDILHNDRLLHDAYGFETFEDFFDSEIDLLYGMGGHPRETDEGVLRGNCWGDNRIDEDSFVEKHAGHGKGFFVVADEERNDGCGGVANLEACIAEGFEGVVGDFPEVFLTLGFGAHDFEGCEDGCGGSGSNGGGEDVGSDAVLHIVDRLGVGGDETADGSEGFGEGAHDDVGAREKAEMIGDSSAFGAENAKAVCFVDHEGGLIFVAEVGHLGEFCYVAFHGEDTVCDDEFDCIFGKGFEDALEVFHVVVAIFEGLGEGECAAFDDGGVVEGVVDDVIVATCDAGDGAGVGLKACGEEEDAVFVEELGELVLELDMDVESSVEEGGTCTTGAVLLGGFDGGFFDFGMVGKTEIAVGSEHEDLLAIHYYFGILVGRYLSEIGVYSFGFCLLGRSESG